MRTLADIRTSFAARFARSKRGSVAIIFAITLVPIISIVSLAIDYGRALNTNSQLITAADAATAAVMLRLPTTAGAIKPYVRVQLDANLPDHLKNLPFDLIVSPKRRRIQLSMKTSVPTALMSIVGVTELEVAIVSTQVIPKTPKIPSGSSIFGGKPSERRENERAMRRVLGGLSNGGSNAPISTKQPSKEDLKKIEETVKQKIREALAKHGSGDLDMEALSGLLGR